MAEEDKQQDAADGDGEKSGGMMKKLALGGGAVALMGIGIAAGPSVMNMISPPEEVAGEEAEGEEAEVPDQPAIYQSLHPPLIINCDDSLGDSHFLQLTLEVMARDQGVINAVREHAPAIRNALILHYTNLAYEEVVTRDGKQKMLDEGLAQVQAVMEERTGEAGVEALYFTGLVIQ